MAATPDATIEAQLRTAAAAGALPAGWTLTSAKDHAAAGRARVATLRYDPPASSSAEADADA